MRWILVAMLFCGVAHAQTIIRYNEPDPDKIRVEKLTDDEVSTLTQLSDAREKALETYLTARDAYQKTKDSMQQKYHAYSQEGKCNKSRVDVEWKGKFIIVEEYPAQSGGISWGGCDSSPIMFTSPANTLTLNTINP